jgi:hypothetical protein
MAISKLRNKLTCSRIAIASEQDNARRENRSLVRRDKSIELKIAILAKAKETAGLTFNEGGLAPRAASGER